MATARDKWADWLLNKRQGGAEKYKDVLPAYFPLRNRVLRGAKLKKSSVLLDVGCGDGLIAFGALDKVGQQGRVIFSDISQDCLDYCREGATEIGALDRCDFVCCSADQLTGIADESVDAVTTRSVLIYVQDKAACFREFYRVLKPGGRVSIFEPINRFHHVRASGKTYLGYDLAPVMHLLDKHATTSKAPEDCSQERSQEKDVELNTNPMLNFNEQDLIDYAWNAGFSNVHLEYEATTSRKEARYDWQTVFYSAPNPNVPTLKERLEKKLSPEELEEFVRLFKPVVDSGKGEAHSAVVYMVAQK